MKMFFMDAKGEKDKSHMESRIKPTIITALIAAFSAALLFLMLCFVLHITPFGDKTFLYEDMKQQYVDFFAYYSNVWHGKDGFFYSKNCGLGADMLGIWAYYLTSPFLFMFVFIPDVYYATAVTFLIMLKIAAATGTTSVFFSYVQQSFFYLKKNALDKSGSNILVSVAFAFSGWMIANMTNIMWLDAVIMMPVVLIGFFKMMRGEKKGSVVYIVSVMFMVVMNYYIAAMIMMFLGVFAVLMVLFGTGELICSENAVTDSDLSFGTRAAKFLKFIAATLGSLVLDAWFLVPTVRSLMGSNKDHLGDNAGALDGYLPSSEAVGKFISPFSVIPKLFSMSYDSLEIMEGMPNIYFGAVLIIPCIIFFLNEKINKKIKQLMGAFLFVIMMFFSIKPLNTLAHGGTEAYGYLYRYSFIFSFVCLMLVYLCLANIDGIKTKSVLMSGAIAFALAIVGFLSKPGFMSLKAWIVNVFILIFAVAILVIYVQFHDGDKAGTEAKKVGDDTCNNATCISSKILMGMLTVVFVLVIITDISMNFISIYRNSSMNAETVSGYMAKCRETEERLEAINQLTKEETGVAYRIESLSPRTPNDALHYGYPGTTTYNSLLKIQNRLFMYKLGFNDNGLYTSYDDNNTECADAILGIKYILKSDGRQGQNINDVGILKEGQTTLSKCVTENLNVLSAEYISDEKIPALLELIKDAQNPFEAQEILWNEFTGREDTIFEAAECERIEAGFKENSAEDTEDSGMIVRYKVRSAADGELYFYMNRDKSEERSLAVYVNDVLVSGYGNASCQKVLNLGYYSEGEELELIIEEYDGFRSLPSEPVVVTELAEKLRVR